MNPNSDPSPVIIGLAILVLPLPIAAVAAAIEVWRERVAYREAFERPDAEAGSE